MLAADSAAAVTQLQHAARTGTTSQAIAAASLADLAASFAPTPREGLQLLLGLLPQEHGKLDRPLRDATMALADSTSLSEPLFQAWDKRRAALAAYRDPLTDDEPDELALEELPHGHHLRAVGVDPGVEKVTNRLARASPFLVGSLGARFGNCRSDI